MTEKPRFAILIDDVSDEGSLVVALYEILEGLTQKSIDKAWGSTHDVSHMMCLLESKGYVAPTPFVPIAPSKSVLEVLGPGPSDGDTVN